jgi:hypothetical protein
MSGLRFIFSLLSLTMFLAGCAFAQTADSFEAEQESLGFMAAEELSESDFAGAPLPSTDSANASTEFQVQDRLIIRTGDLSIIVANTDDGIVGIRRVVEGIDGWVVSSEFRQANGGKTGTITVRVPADHFDDTVDQIKELAHEVVWESSNSQDVTEEFIDLSARLENLEATADRVRTFLDDAKNVEEALSVNQELSRLEGEIEALKGRIQYLSQSAAFSTLTIELTPDELSQPIEVAGWRPEGVARSAIEALVGALQSLADLLIWLVIFCLPLVILIGIPGYLVVRFSYRRWQRRKDTNGSDDQDEDINNQ